MTVDCGDRCSFDGSGGRGGGNGDCTSSLEIDFSIDGVLAHDELPVIVGDDFEL